MTLPSLASADSETVDPGATIRIPLSRISALIFLGSYLVFLYVALRDVIGPVYAYMGIALKADLPLGHMLLGALCAGLVMMALPLDFHKPSIYTIWFLYVALIAPVLTFGLHFFAAPIHEGAGFLTLLTASFLFLVFLVRLPSPTFNIVVPQTGPIFWLAVGCFSLLVVFLRFALLPFSWDDLSLVDIYDRRFAARDLVDAGTLMAYLMASMNAFLIPLCTLGLVAYRVFAFAPLLVVMVVAQFSYDGQKFTLLAPFAVWGLTLLAKSSRSFKAHALIIGFASVAVVSVAEFKLLNSIEVGANVLRRGVFVPARLTCAYFDYFSVEPFSYFSGTRLAPLFEASGEVPSSRRIGYDMSGDYRLNANANIFASAYSELGVLGLFVIPVLAAIFLKIIDATVLPRRRILPTYAAFWCGFVWTNQSIHISFLSSGVALAMVAALISPYDAIQEEQTDQ